MKYIIYGNTVRVCNCMFAHAVTRPLCITTDSYAHRDEVVKAKRSDKRAVEEYLKYALSYVESQVSKHPHTTPQTDVYFLISMQNHVMMKPFAWYPPKLDPQKWGEDDLHISKSTKCIYH